MAYSKISDNLYLIDLDQDIPGFRKFISSWLYLGKSSSFIVDPGPLNSIDNLFETLDKIGIKSLEYILLTHIHIDHAGGTGKLLEKYPEATVICHPKGIDHMIDPSKLWEGSVKVLGDIARSYGKIVPVPPDCIISQEKLETANGPILVIPTPGHAIHHQCFQFQDWLFAGEVAGVRHVSGSDVYARPATPPVFKLEISLSSLDRVIGLNPPNLCLGHYGYLENPSLFLADARKQLLLWVETVKQELAKGKESVTRRIIEELKKKDKLVAGFDNLDEDIKQREEYFFKNSLKGMLHYLQNQS